MSAPLITFRQLSVSFAAEKQRVRAVQEVSFAIHAGQTVGIVGESGCGKSVTAMALMGLLPPQAARIDSGEILFNGQDLLRLKANPMADLRGNQRAEPGADHRRAAVRAAHSPPRRNAQSRLAPRHPFDKRSGAGARG